jgi:hypothetical protein
MVIEVEVRFVFGLPRPILSQKQMVPTALVRLVPFAEKQLLRSLFTRTEYILVYSTNSQHIPIQYQREAQIRCLTVTHQLSIPKVHHGCSSYPKKRLHWQISWHHFQLRCDSKTSNTSEQRTSSRSAACIYPYSNNHPC